MKKKFTAMTLASVSLMGQAPSEVPLPSKDLGYFVEASFIYWYAKEDGLNGAESAQVDSSGTTIFSNAPAVFQQTFSFHPGFQVSAGLFFAKDWMIQGEYTYYRGKNEVSRKAPEGSTGVGVWNVDSWYSQKTFYSDQSLTGTNLSSTWKISLDMADLLLTRPPCKESGFGFAPFGGVRAVWIEQQMNFALIEEGASFGGDSFLGPQPTTSKNKSNAWGIGPRLGVEGSYNLPLGFHLNGSIGTTLFFEKFTKIKHSESAAAIYYEPPGAINTSYTCVRPEIDLGLGLGFRMNIGKRQSIHCLASYDFLYFWSQNMMRHTTDEFFAGTSAGSLDLYFQGLTFKINYSF